jgi:hypothetical protein
VSWGDVLHSERHKDVRIAAVRGLSPKELRALADLVMASDPELKGTILFSVAPKRSSKQTADGTLA